MAESNNRPGRTEKRQLRAERKAAQLAQEQALAEKLEHERRQQTIIGIIVVVIVVALIAVIGVVVYRNVHKNSASESQSASESYNNLQQVKTKPVGANKQGGFLLSKNGYNKSIANVPTVSEYFDPLCPGCGAFNRQVDPTITSLVDAGQINLVLYPMSFLDQNSSDSYSSRASGAVAYIATHDSNPDHLLAYIANIYASGFQPQEGTSYKSVSNAALNKQAVKAGVSQSVADKAFGGEYQKWLDAINTYTPKRPELWNTSGSNKGAMTTPTVTFNGKMLDMNRVSDLGLSLKSAVLQSLGLTESQVGKEGELPSIGAQGKPVTLKSA